MNKFDWYFEGKKEFLTEDNSAKGQWKAFGKCALILAVPLLVVIGQKLF